MKVSIIVPIYNSAKYLVKCLDSIVNQTYQNLEIILVNDGSTDNSIDIIKNYQEKNNNIMVYNIENHGQGYARNLGIKNSHGDYVMFIDSDDYVDVDIVQKLVDNIMDSDVIVCDMYEVRNGKKIYHQNYHVFGNDQISFMLSQPGPVAKLYKRGILEKALFMENVYYEDLAFTPIVALNVHKISYLQEAKYYYIIHDNSTMQSKVYNPKMDSIFKVINYLKEKLINYPLEYQYLLIEHLLYSATLRYIDYPECQKQLLEINDIIKKEDNWQNNKYFIKKSYKFKMICKLAYRKKYRLLRILKRVSGK